MIFPLKPSFSSGIFQQAMFDYQYRRVYLSGTMTLIFAAQQPMPLLH